MTCGVVRSPGAGCASRKLGGRDWTLEELIASYLDEYAEDRAKADRWWSRAPTPEEALIRAFYDWEPGESPPRRILNSHQRRLGYPAVARASAAAQKHSSLLMRARDFDELLSAFQAVWRLEEIFVEATLLTYDVAERFGRYRGIQPTAVYLHAGAAEGANALGIRTGARVDRSRFGPQLGKLTASEIENFLCVCKANLRRDMLDASP